MRHWLVLCLITTIYANLTTLGANDSSTSLACAALPWLTTSPNVPYCPTGNNTKLPETYPASAVIVSAQPSNEVEPTLHIKFATDVISNILIASGDELPLIVLPTNKSSFKEIQLALEEKFKGQPQLKRLNSILVQVPRTDNTTWQQDYFESFFDPKTGTPVLRAIDSYPLADGVGYHFRKLMRTLKEKCVGSFKNGPDLRAQNIKLQNGQSQLPYAGGNIEALPGGLCLTGNTQDPRYTSQYCGDRDNAVFAPTSWLSTEHVDELVSVVRRKDKQPPCDFAISVASPHLARQLLLERPKDRFFETSEDFFRDYSHFPTIRFCIEVKKYLFKKKNEGTKHKQEKEIEIKPRARKTTQIFDAVESSALADPLDDYKKRSNLNPELALEYDKCLNSKTIDLTNSEVAEYLGTKNVYATYNEIVQKHMIQLKKTISQKLKSRLPQCEVKFLDMPQLFTGGGEALVRKNPIELANKSGEAIFPNATNGISIRDTVLTPKQYNTAFSNYIDKAYRGVGLKSSFVDTYYYAHMRLGNLHCATHLIPFCKPRPSETTNKP